ncbi:hypothetical protein ACFW5V_36415 [Streptomyces sp. NPDC058762]|uniref:hypothetical protein n=1 Tax=Streptomyces sp. NPDC058762 TaxID=3346629 RepID=UPI0036B50118
MRLWRVGRALVVTFAAAVLVAGGVFYGLVYLLDFQEIDSKAKLDAATLFDLVKLSFGVVAGAGALVALVVAYRRQRVHEAGPHREATSASVTLAAPWLTSTAVRPSNDAVIRTGNRERPAGLMESCPGRSIEGAATIKSGGPHGDCARARTGGSGRVHDQECRLGVA